MSRTRIAAVSIALFLISLALPAIRQPLIGDTRPEDPANISGGLSLLALGWMGMEARVFSWFANPLYVAGMAFYLRRSRKHYRWLFTLALLFALSTFIRVGLPFQSDASGGNRSMIILLAGFYVWTASMVVAAIGAWLPERLKGSPGAPR